MLVSCNGRESLRAQVSFEMSEYTAEVDGLGTLRLLNALRTCGLEKVCRFYQASTRCVCVFVCVCVCACAFIPSPRLSCPQ